MVDDSALMRGLLSQMINLAPDMEVVGAAPDAQSAREMIKVLNPDVLTLDVQMPKMDGLEFLERLMRLRPMPVVMVSSYTEAGSDTTLKALELGAIDFIGKPKADGERSMENYAEELVEKIRAAKGARLRRTMTGHGGGRNETGSDIGVGKNRLGGQRENHFCRRFNRRNGGNQGFPARYSCGLPTNPDRSAYARNVYRLFCAPSG